MRNPYYELVKPGIIYGNTVTAAAGYLVAARAASRLAPLVMALFGLALVIAAGCIINNYLDRDLDARMPRTKARLFAGPGAPAPVALLGAAVLAALAGLALLYWLAPLAALAALAGLILYVPVYTMWAKRRTPYATHLGALAGATPPLVGYFAAGGAPDALALALFLMLFTWQLPHFFAIAIYRADEYRAAGVPVLPVARGERSAVRGIAVWGAAFMLAAAAPWALGAAGPGYLAVVVVLAGGWWALALAGFAATNTRAWARRVFFASLAVLIGVFGALALDALFF